MPERPTWRVHAEDLEAFCGLVNDAYDPDFNPEREDQFNDEFDHICHRRLQDILTDLQNARAYIASVVG